MNKEKNNQDDVVIIKENNDNIQNNSQTNFVNNEKVKPEKESLPGLALAGAIINIIISSFPMVAFAFFLVQGLIFISTNSNFVENTSALVILSIFFIPSLLSFIYNIKLVAAGRKASKGLYLKAGIFGILGSGLIGGIFVLVGRE